MMGTIPLYVDNGKAYVWNPDDWYTIRSEHRICGSMIGSLPSFPRQNDFLGKDNEIFKALSHSNCRENVFEDTNVYGENSSSLPMALMSEEAALLVEKGICELFELPDLTKTPSQDLKADVKVLEENILQEQKEALKKRKIEQLSQKIEIIMAGKRKKLLAKGLSDAHLDKDALLQEEINKLPELSPAHILVHLPRECFLNTEKVKVGVDSLNPSVIEGKGATKFAVFKDLWEKKYYITTGSKFGAEYLVYPGDPVKFHATYMVRCVEQESSFATTNYVTFGRLAVAVNKLAVYAYYNNDKIEYQTVQWHDSIK